ncbi:ABC transporter permease [Salmonella enterica]|nr:ABC transporter permease [Salmonella enterica subsp. enterica serovar Gombe]EIE6438689.1 ABC transporter permease [Salmonella enterica]EIG1434221.1 ABC transporter permease [Salmonella enterica]EIG1439176.1 ABC transporter permease [Salmonella enterica]
MSIMEGKVKRIFEVLYILTQKEIKIKYKNNSLGYLWALVNPLFFTVIYYYAFKVFMKVQVDNYPLFLVCALFPWQWISNSINNGAWCFLGNSQIIKKTSFPKFTLILSNIFMEGFHFIMALPVIFIFLVLSGFKIHIESVLYIPLFFFLQTIIIMGISLTFSTLCVFFRDVERFVVLGMTALFYGTPIFYSSDMIPEKFKWVLKINPFAQLITIWRNLFMRGEIEWSSVVNISLWACFLLLIGCFVYNKMKFKFAEVM